MLNNNSVLFILGDTERMSKSGETIKPASVCLLKLKAPIEPIPFFVACVPMHVKKKKTAIAEEAT